MKALIVGAWGQAGRALQQTAPQDIEIVAPNSKQLDLTNPTVIQKEVERHRPQLVINTAAYTAVDRAESEKETAYEINARGAGHLALMATHNGARVIHISTDFVFDGMRSSPYRPTDPPNPLNIYGASKLEGEERVSAATAGQALIIRTSWLYSANGTNFVNTMLRLMSSRGSIGVVADQIGSPTWARTLAEAIWCAAMKPELTGIYHCSDAGTASWYDFAMAIQEEALAANRLNHGIAITPLATTDYPTPARRPAYSVLEKSATWRDIGTTPNHWRVALRAMMKER